MLNIAKERLYKTLSKANTIVLFIVLEYKESVDLSIVNKDTKKKNTK